MDAWMHGCMAGWITDGYKWWVFSECEATAWMVDGY